jgi:hypothetical protein
MAEVLPNASYEPVTNIWGLHETRTAVTEHLIADILMRKPWAPKGIERHTECLDHLDNLRKMDYELRKPAIPILTKALRLKKLARLAPVEIYCIGAVGFYRTLIKPDVKPFVTSLYKIDRVIEDKEIEDIHADSARKELENQELIEQKLPQQYYDFKDVFSKAASDLLAPHWPYDLKIKLEEGKAQGLKFSPLY